MVKSKSADVIVVGAGVIGCAVAYHLAREGVSVLLLERGRVGREASWASAGILPHGHPASTHPYERLATLSPEPVRGSGRGARRAERSGPGVSIHRRHSCLSGRGRDPECQELLSRGRSDGYRGRISGAVRPVRAGAGAQSGDPGLRSVSPETARSGLPAWCGRFRWRPNGWEHESWSIVRWWTWRSGPDA